MEPMGQATKISYIFPLYLAHCVASGGNLRMDVGGQYYKLYIAPTTTRTGSVYNAPCDSQDMACDIFSAFESRLCCISELVDAAIPQP